MEKLKPKSVVNVPSYNRRVMMVYGGESFSIFSISAGTVIQLKGKNQTGVKKTDYMENHCAKKKPGKIYE